MSLSKLINKLFEKFSLEDLDKEKNLILSKMPLNYQNYGCFVWQEKYNRYKYNPLKSKKKNELNARKRANKKLKYYAKYW